MGLIYETEEDVCRAFLRFAEEAGLTISENEYGRIKQNDQVTDTRCAFVDFVDGLSKDGQISAELAHNVTLDI